MRDVDICFNRNYNEEMRQIVNIVRYLELIWTFGYRVSIIPWEKTIFCGIMILQNSVFNGIPWNFTKFCNLIPAEFRCTKLRGTLFD